MFFGCRHKNEDYIYQEELEEAEKNGVLTQLNVAFSRDQEQKVSLSSCPLELNKNIFMLFKILNTFLVKYHIENKETLEK